MNYCVGPTQAPENVSVALLTSTSVEISWNPPPPAARNGIITEYRISVLELDTGRQHNRVAYATSFVIQSLHPSYSYHFSVSAHTVQSGPYSAVQVLQIPEDGKNFSCTDQIMVEFPPHSSQWIPTVVHEGSSFCSFCALQLVAPTSR